MKLNKDSSTLDNTVEAYAQISDSACGACASCGGSQYWEPIYYADLSTN